MTQWYSLAKYYNVSGKKKLNGFIKTLDKVKNVRFIEFMEDNKLIDTNYEDAILKVINWEWLFKDKWK